MEDLALHQQSAYHQPRYEKAKKALDRIAKELRLINGSAVESLREGLEETLTLHWLGLFEELGTSFKTTNCLENVNRQLERLTHRVSYWKNSDQRQRWTATALLEIEPRLRKVKGFRHLKALRKAMKKESHPYVGTECLSLIFKYFSRMQDGRWQFHF